jgi:hypothetical protein
MIFDINSNRKMDEARKGNKQDGKLEDSCESQRAPAAHCGILVCPRIPNVDL